MAEKIQVTVKDVIKETNDTISIHFNQPSEKLTYLSGQYLTLITEINGEEIRRPYSLCSSDFAGDDPAVAVKRVKGGVMSNYLNDNLKAGDTLEILPPMGNFAFQPNSDQQRHLVLIAGGSGITPMFSILKTMLLEEPKSMVTLLYFNSSNENVIFSEQLHQWQEKYPGRFRLYNYFSKEQVEVQKKKSLLGGIFGGNKKTIGLSGRADKQKILTLFEDYLNIEPTDPIVFFLCGPQGLMKAAEDAILSKGIKSKQIFKESFFLDSDTKENKEVQAQAEMSGDAQVTVKLNGSEETFVVPAGKSILQSALEKGIELPFSCQSGLCTACMGKCKEGSVIMKNQEALSDDDIKGGYVLTCVGYPGAEKVVIEIE